MKDRWPFAVALLVGVAACYRYDLAELPIVLDNQTYFTIAERAASGVAPHVSQFDPKNALSMLLTAAAMAVGRLFGADDVYAARAAGVLATGLTFSLVWLAARRLWQSRTAAWGAVVSLLVFHGFTYLGAMGSRPKVFLAMFEALALFAAAERRFALLGVAAAASYLCWQPALLLLGPAGLVALADEERWRAFGRTMGAALAVVGVYELYFLLHGALADQLWQSLVFPFRYPKPGYGVGLTLERIFDVSVLLDRLRGADDWSPQSLATLVGNHTSRKGVVMLLFAAGLAATTAAALVRPRTALRAARERPGLWFLVLVSVGAVAFLTTDYQGYPDRFFVLPMAAVVAGWVATWPLRAVERRAPWFQVPSALLALGLAYTIVSAPHHNVVPYKLKDQRAAAAAVRQVLEDGYTVYAIGAPHLVAMNRVGNFNEYGFFPWRIRAHFLDRARRHGQWIPQKNGKMPDVVLTSRAGFSINSHWLERHFRRSDRLLFSRQSVRVWVRRGLPYNLVPGRALRRAPPPGHGQGASK